jgi:uncharacterized protein YbaP (TraB family)
MKSFAYKGLFGVALVTGCIWPQSYLDAASVWKVTHSSGKVLYLGGSIHALRKTDYPLPVEYNRAFDASNHVVFEVDLREMKKTSKTLLKTSQYPPGDSLKNHVDPRTYNYVRRFFREINVPEEKFAKLRPWCLAFMLASPQLHGLSADLGVEGFLTKRAEAKSKPITGLETVSESINRYSELSDRQGELMLLMSFIPAERGLMDQTKQAWRRGDSETIWQLVHQTFRDVPSIAEREITSRNHNWIPKIENFLQSGDTYFVVVGAAHMGGPNGLLSLLGTRGYKIQRL